MLSEISQSLQVMCSIIPFIVHSQKGNKKDYSYWKHISGCQGLGVGNTGTLRG